MTQEEATAFLKAMKQMAQAIVTALAPFAAAYAHLARSLYAAMWHSYIMAGAPYGETRKGLEQWLKEQHLIHQ